MFRFTIRDVLWLTAMVALAFGWGLSARNASQKHAALTMRLYECEMDRQLTQQYWDGAQEVLDGAGIEWPKPVWSSRLEPATDHHP